MMNTMATPSKMKLQIDLLEGAVEVLGKMQKM